MGKAIQTTISKKYIWWLYITGALCGGIVSTFFQKPSPYIQPQMGPSSVLGAYLTFLACYHPEMAFSFFSIPIRAWVVVATLGAYSLLADPHKQLFAGITAGFTLFQMTRVGLI